MRQPSSPASAEACALRGLGCRATAAAAPSTKGERDDGRAAVPAQKSYRMEAMIRRGRIGRARKRLLVRPPTSVRRGFPSSSPCYWKAFIRSTENVTPCLGMWYCAPKFS